MYVNNWLTRREMLTPDKVALIDATHGNRRITFREWNRAVNRTANFLRDGLRVQKGDRIAVLARNSVEYLDLWFACGKLGAIIQLLNWRLTAHELTGLLADATPKVFVYSREFIKQTDALRSNAPSVQHWVALDDPEPSDVHFADRESCPDAEPPEVGLDWNDPWAICYTGGTTGLPKGAILTHRSITANSVNTVMSWGLTPEDVSIIQLPLFHTGAFNVFTAPLVHMGGTSIVCSAFDVDQTFDLIRDEGVTLFVGVPTMYIVMQQHARWATADLSRLKICGSGGASCPLPVIERFRERGIDLFTGYGLTEAGPNNFWLPKEARAAKPGSVGSPLIHVDVKIVDDKGQALGTEAIGELLIRGPHVCAGYWGKPEETAKAITPEGWLHTGDLARRDAGGHYYIVGRNKDMIKSGGENVYPAEVESVLHGHPAVAEAALIGVPDAKWGEVGRAIVVRKPGASLAEQELIAFCQERLAKYKIPKSVVFVSSLPKTAASKVDKKLLTEQYGR
ncbi:MAG: long-chain fatty acid--CoA ligase [Anaerolineae bacterium]